MANATTPSSWGLRQVDLLQGLSADRLDALCRSCAWRPYEAGERLVMRDDAKQDVFFIVGGRVRVTTYSSAGRETSFRELAAGSSFGELSALDGKPRSADVVALTSGLIASLPAPAFRDLLRMEWAVNERVLLRLTDLARGLMDRVLEVSTLHVHQRVCVELLRLACADGCARNEARIDPVPRHAEIAHRISSYREQVTRELSVLVKAGVLAKSGPALVVRDLERLRRLAEQPPARDAEFNSGA